MEKTRITGTAVAERILREKMADLDHEEAWVIFLNGRAEPISVEMISKGTFSSTAIDARTIIRRALLLNATAFIIAHNHPSGKEAPSPADIEFTRTLKVAADMFDILLVDHLIITDESYFSFCEDRSFHIIK